MFKKIYLDPFYFNSLEQIAIQEKWSTKSRFKDYMHSINQRNNLRFRTLLLLTLFDQFDSFYYVYDTEKFQENGLIDKDSFLSNPHKLINVDGGMEMGRPESLSAYFKPFVSDFWKNNLDSSYFEKQSREGHAWETSHKVIQSSANSLVKLFLKNRNYITENENIIYAGHYTLVDLVRNDLRIDRINKNIQYYTGNRFIDQNTILNYLKENAHLEFKERYYLDNFDMVLNEVFKDSFNYGLKSMAYFFEVDYPLLGPFYTFLKYIFHSTSKAIFLSSKENASIAHCFNFIARDSISKTLDINNSLSYLLSLQLKNEIKILPYPRTLNDVIKLRNRIELKDFKEVVEHWIKCIQAGDSSKIERKIRADISKANKALRGVHAWREYKESPLNFWINSIGGQLPLVSNIITAIYTIGDASSWYLDKKYQWIKVLQ